MGRGERVAGNVLLEGSGGWWRTGVKVRRWIEDRSVSSPKSSNMHHQSDDGVDGFLAISRRDGGDRARQRKTPRTHRVRR